MSDYFEWLLQISFFLVQIFLNIKQKTFYKNNKIELICEK